MRSVLIAVFFLLVIAICLTCSYGDPEIEISTTTLKFKEPQTSQSFTIRNVGGDDGLTTSGVKNLHFQIECDDAWVTYSPASGVVAQNESVVITVSVDWPTIPTSVSTCEIKVLSNADDEVVTVQVEPDLDAPILRSPGELVSNLDCPVVGAPRPEFTWLPVDHAYRYELQIDDRPTFTDPLVLRESDVKQTAYPPYKNLPGDTLYWRVRGISVEGNAGDWSTVWHFICAPIPDRPILTDPDCYANTEDSTPTFKWRDVPYAAVYHIMVDNNMDFHSNEFKADTKDSTVTIPDSKALSPGVYYWTVQAENIAGGKGNWSDTCSVRVEACVPGAPPLKTPLNHDTLEDPTPTFDWEDVPCACTYRLLVSRNAGFTDCVINLDGLQFSIYTPLEPLSEGKYYWRIQAKNCDGTQGPASETRDFTIDLPICCEISPTTLPFGDVCVKTSAERTFTIRNCGTTGSPALSGTISVSCSDYSIVSGGGAYSLNPGQSRSVTVRFTPSSVGTKTCTIETGNNACTDVSCSGTGKTCDDCSVTPSALPFGTVCVGATKELPFTITNRGPVSYSGTVSASCSDFIIVSGGGSYTLAPDSSRAVTVRFQPTSSGSKTCSVNTGCPINPVVSCTGIGEVVCCNITPTSLNFGSVTCPGSLEKSFTITNCSVACTLTGTISESSDPGGAYSIVSGGGAYSLNPGHSRTVTVKFTPPAAGTYNCTIETGNNACSDVSCTGNGIPIPPCCDINPSNLDFGDVCLGESADREFTIRNCGGAGAPVLSGSVSESCNDYSIVSGDGPYTLNPGESRSVTVRFTPSSTGTKACTVETGNNLCSDVVCSGGGDECECCTVTPTQLDFGNVCPNDFKDLACYIVNCGSQDICGTVRVYGTDFAIISGGGDYCLSPSHSREVVVRLAPTTLGPKSGTVQFGNSACSAVELDGIVSCEEAWLLFDNFRKVNGEMVCDVSGRTGLNNNLFTLVEYDVADMDGENMCGDASPDLHLWQSTLVGADYNWVYPRYGSLDGIPVPSTCTVARQGMQGRLEVAPSNYDDGFFVKTNRCDRQLLSIGISCGNSIWGWNRSCLFNSPIPTRFEYWFYRPSTTADGWISEMIFDFTGWWVPLTPSVNRTTIRVIPSTELNGSQQDPDVVEQSGGSVD